MNKYKGTPQIVGAFSVWWKGVGYTDTVVLEIRISLRVIDTF